jgi:hypothetical protein|tara:strand:+ start:4742 stop:4867 length:126 start_codon:yes stop_codon:yes gene_type:complete
MNDLIKMIRQIFNVNGAVICIAILVLSIISIKLFKIYKISK